MADIQKAVTIDERNAEFEQSRDEEAEKLMRERPPTYNQVQEQDQQLAGTSSDGLLTAKGDAQAGDLEMVFSGLLKERKMRDYFCTVVFGLYILLMGVLFIYAIVRGDIGRLLSDCNMKVPSPTENENTVFNNLFWTFRNGAVCIVGMAGIAIVFSAIVMLLLRFFAKVVIWTVVILVASIGLVVAIAFWVLFFVANNETFLVVAILTTIIAVGIFSILYFFRNRVKLVIKIAKEAGCAIQAAPVILLQPLVTCLLQLGVLAGGIYLGFLVESIVYIPEGNSDHQCQTTPVAKIGRTFNIIGLLWLPLFISSSQQIIVAGVVSIWFFKRDKKNLGKPVLTSCWNYIKYNIGTAALGAFLVTLVKGLHYTVKFLKRFRGCRCLTYRICCCLSIDDCVNTLDRFIGVLSTNAYIIVGLYGYGFFPAAKRASKFIVENAVNLVVINTVGAFVLILAKLSIVGGSMGLGWLIVQNVPGIYLNGRLFYLMLEGIIVCWLIASAFIGMYEIAMNTIFMCFCVDKEKHGYRQPYFMSSRLQKILVTDANTDVGDVIRSVRNNIMVA